MIKRRSLIVSLVYGLRCFPGLSGCRCLYYIRVTYTWKPTVSMDQHTLADCCGTSESILSKVLGRSYKIKDKKFPKVSHSIVHSPPLELPVILIPPSLFPLSYGPYDSCSAHDVKRVGFFCENIKIKFQIGRTPI